MVVLVPGYRWVITPYPWESIISDSSAWVCLPGQWEFNWAQCQ